MRQYIALLTAFLLLLSAVPAAARHDEGPSLAEEIQIQRERAERTQHQMKHSLASMEELARRLPPCDVRDELLGEIRRTQRLAGRMASNTERLLWVAGSLVPERSYSPQAMSDDEFGRIRAAKPKKRAARGRAGIRLASMAPIVRRPMLSVEC